MTVMVNFSGGIDSTLVALKALQTDHNIILHHVILKNKMNRWRPELKAVQRLLSLFEQDYSFEYIETTLDTNNINMTYDSLYTTQMASAICFSRQHFKAIHEVWMGFNKDDNLAFFDYQRVLEAPFNNPPKLIMPLKNKTKKEIIKELPDKYLQECFWCRTPNKNGTPCCNCHACRLYQRSKG